MGSNSLAACIVALIALVHAAPSPAADDLAPPTNTVGDLGVMQAETLRLRAQNELIQEQRLKEAYEQSKFSNLDGPREADPVVARVIGRTAQPTAYILMGNGSIVPATEGTTLPGGYEVITVSAQRVVVRRNGQTMTLGFSTRLPAAPGSAAGPGVARQ